MEAILLKRLLKSAVQRVLSREFFGIIFLIFASLYTFARVGYFAPSGGDIAVWIFTHEWLSRGNTLYEGVWDHKDWGFFAITHPFFQLAGIKGLYIAALLSVCAFTIGVFLLVRRLTTFNKSLLISFLATITYTSSPSFLATYTENYSISLSVLALGLIFKHPSISGAIFALSVAVKISGILVFVVVIGLHLSIQYFVFNYTAQSIYKRFAKIAGGFLLVSLMILTTTSMQGTLNGWIDVIDYNLEYGKIRRELMPPFLDIIKFLKFASPGDAVILFLLVLGLVVLFSFVLTQTRAVKLNDDIANSSEVIEPLVLSVGISVATLAVMLVQFPPSSQHWQYFVGGAVTLLSVLVSILWQTSLSPRLRVLVLVVVLLPTTAGIGTAVNSAGIQSFNAGIMRWIDSNENGEQISLLRKVPPDSTIAFINSGSALLDSKSLPGDINLSCRFFYNFPHLLPRYGDQMLACLEKGLNYVVFRKTPLLDLEFQGRVLRIMDEKYYECSIPEDEFRIWVSEASLCSSSLPNL